MPEHNDKIPEMKSKKVRDEFQHLRQSYEKKFEADTKDFRESLATQTANQAAKQAAKQTRRLLIGVIVLSVGAAATASLGIFYKATRDVNESVITLQDHFIAARDRIAKTEEEMRDAENRMTNVEETISKKEKRLKTAMEHLAQAEKDLQSKTKEFEVLATDAAQIKDKLINLEAETNVAQAKLNKTLKDLEDARTDLATTKEEYDIRLKEIRD